MKQLKLNKLVGRKMAKKEVQNIRGGYMADDSSCPDYACGCGCYHANSGGASTNGNYNANHKGMLYSPYRGDPIVYV